MAEQKINSRLGLTLKMEAVHPLKYDIPEDTTFKVSVS
jgi:hypothetical protein